MRWHSSTVAKLIGHDLWLLLGIIPEKIHPESNLDLLQEVKLCLGQKPQMCIGSLTSSPRLLQISENIVTEEMLDMIVVHWS